MQFFKIKSQLIYNEIFSFMKEKRKLEIIKYSKYLHQKLDILIPNYKEIFFLNKFSKYNNYSSVYNYWIQFNNTFRYENNEDLFQLFLTYLSKKKDLILNLTDINFNILIKSRYFNDNMNIELKNLDISPKELLIQENKFTHLSIKILREIFELFSSNGKMSKEQSIKFINTFNNQTQNNYNNNILFSYANDGFLLFENFLEYYFTLIQSNFTLVFENLIKFYNILEKNRKYDIDYLKSHFNKLERNIILSNFLQIINKKIQKLCINELIKYILIF